jgi:hypothetical protein
MNMNASNLDPIQDAVLDRRLSELNREMARFTAPAALEGALVAKFRRARRPERARPRLWWMPPLALAATVGVVSWMVRGPMPANPASWALPPIVEESPESAPFLALKPMERIALEPATTVVATEFPRALLADWGLPVSPDRAGELVRAEMLYSADGEALAVRIVN